MANPNNLSTSSQNSSNADPWASLANASEFSSIVTSKLDAKTKSELDATLAQIDEDEAKDYANEYKISHNHTEEEYARFRKEAIDSAVAKKLAELSPEEQAELDAKLAQIDEDEAKDYANGFKIRQNHSREEYDRYRQEAIANAIATLEATHVTGEEPQTVGEKAEAIADKLKDFDEVIASKEAQPEDQGNGVEVGDIDIKGVEQEFADIKTERIAELKEKLDHLLKGENGLAELYARNRRLIAGPKNRAEFTKVKGEYGELLDEYLKLKAGETHEKGKQEIAEKLESRIEELKSEIEAKLTEFMDINSEEPEKTQVEVDAEKERLIKEAEATLKAEYKEMIEALEAKVNAEFLEDFLAQEVALEEATIDKLDNGTLCRKFVNKVINNKALKGVLIAAAVAGLAVTGIGLAAGVAAGTVTSVSLGGFTVGGVAAGTAKGGIMGGLMSRQNSKNSAVRGLASEESIKQDLGEVKALGQEDSDVANVAGWLLDQYETANTEDRISNRKRTAVAAGIGAAIGALASGVQIGSTEQTTVTNRELIGHQPVEYHASNLENVNIAEGHGAYDTFTQLGGDPAKYNQFEQIMFNIDAKYGLSPGSNSVVPGYNGTVGDFAHTYPGRIADWPDVAQQYITEVANEAARQGLIPGHQTGGGPIYDITTKAVEGSYIPSAFHHALVEAVSNVLPAAIGGAVGGLKGSNNEKPTTTPEPEPEPTPEPTSEPEPEPEPTPEPTPEPEPEPQPEESNPEAPAPEEPASGEASPTRPEAEERSFRDQAIAELGDIIGPEGIEMVVMERPAEDSSALEAEIELTNLWNGLSDEAKGKVIAFEQAHNQVGSEGNFLRSWLQRNNLLEVADIN